MSSLGVSSRSEVVSTNGSWLNYFVVLLMIFLIGSKLYGAVFLVVELEACHNVFWDECCWHSIVGGRGMLIQSMLAVTIYMIIRAGILLDDTVLQILLTLSLVVHICLSTSGMFPSSDSVFRSIPSCIPSSHRLLLRGSIYNPALQ